MSRLSFYVNGSYGSSLGVAGVAVAWSGRCVDLLVGSGGGVA